MRLDHLLSKDDTKSEGDWLAPTGAGGLARRLRPNKVCSCVGYSEKLTQCVAATARPKRPEGLGAEARQYEKHRRLPIDNDAKISYNDACRFV